MKRVRVSAAIGLQAVEHDHLALHWLHAEAAAAAVSLGVG